MKKLLSGGIFFTLIILLLVSFVLAFSSVTVNSPTTGQNASGTITLNATTDAAAVNVTFQWQDATSGAYVLNTTIYNDTASDTDFTNTSFDTTVLTDGVYNITVNATNSTGATVIDASVTTITVDNTAPTVTLETANNTNTTDTTPDISFNFTDALFTTANCAIFVDGSSDVSNTSTINATSTTLTLSALSDGSHTYFANCTDGSGNSGVSGTNSITVDATNPAVTAINSPASGANLTTGTQVFNATVTDATLNVDTVRFNITNGSSFVMLTASQIGNNWNASLNMASLTEGSHNVTVLANDTLGNLNNTEIVTFTVDTVVPSVSAINSPAANANLSTGTQVFNATVTDATLNIDTVRFNITNGSSFVMLTASNPGGNDWNSSLNLGALAEGSHTMTVLANDTVGNLNNSETLTFTVDSVAPTVNSVYPNNQNYNSNNILVGYNYQDNIFSTATCSFYFDGVLNNTNATAPNGTNIFTNLVGFADGVHNYTTNCTDPAGNVGSMALINFTMDSTPPVVSFNTPTGGSNLSTGTQVFNATVSDATIGVDVVLFNITNGSSSVLLTANNPAGNDWNASLDLSTLAQGSHTATVIANDSLNNLNNSETVTFTVDSVPPTVTLITGNNTNTTDSTPDISFNYTDAQFVAASCAIYVDGSSDVSNTSTANATSTTLTLSALSDGTHSYYVNCTDGSGNSGVSGTNSLTVDTIPPSVTALNSPSSGVNLSTETQVFNATVSDATIGVDVVLFNITNGSSSVLLTANNPAGNDWNASLDLSTLAEEVHTVTVQANDSAGNLNNSVSVTFTVDRTAPTVSIVNSSFNTTDTTPSITFNYTDALFATASCTLYLNGTAYAANSAVSNATSTTLTVNTTLSDGTYSTTVNCSDGSSNVGASSSINIGLDTGAPAVTTFNTPSVSSFHNTTSFVLNVTVTGTPTTVQYTIENGSNSSDTILAYTSMSNSAGNFWNATVATGSLTETNYTIRINATDATGNSNSTETLLFAVDTTNPVNVSISCSDVTVGASRSCSCSYDDNSENYGGTTTNTSISGGSTSSAGTSIATCTVYDNAGNSNSSTASFTVSATASSSGGGGAGGSSGGVSNTVSDQYSKKVWTSIYADESASIELEGDEIGVTEVEFVATDDIYGAWLRVSASSTDDFDSANVEEYDFEVYKYFDITVGNALDENNIEDIVIYFKVNKDWLDENNFASEEIALFHYNEDSGQWKMLETTIKDSDSDFVYFSAPTDWFSYFVIGINPNYLASLSSVDEVLAEEDVIVEDDELADEAINEVEDELSTLEVESKTSKIKYLFGLIILIGLGALIYYFVKYFNKHK